MNQKLIDLTIIDIETNEKMKLNNAIGKFKNIVLLGTSGSGKSSLLKKFQEENQEKVKLTTVKEFIEFSLSNDKEMLFLDALDEYRSFENDKNFVIKKLAYRLKDYQCKKLISCRELDWYEDTDTIALQNIVGEEFRLFKIDILDKSHQRLMISTLNSTIDKEQIIKDFEFSGFLKNPQLLKMIVNVYKNNQTKPKNKKEIFETFILKAGKEHNNSYNHEILSDEDIFKLNGYLSIFYLFSKVDSFNDDFLSQIATDEFSLSKLNTAIKTKIYTKDNFFMHRTIAEYLCAKFLIDYKLKSQSILNRNRVKNLFITKHDKVISELRGVYSWIGVLTKDLDFIGLDPFYQLIYADNSFFDESFKKDIILSIKEYTKKHPYFFENHVTIFLNSFYEEELDDFLIKEIKETIESKNHYPLLLTYIIKDSEYISNKMKEFIYSKILDNKLDAHLKANFIVHLTTNEKKDILDKIIFKELSDDKYNTLKEKILKYLYPKDISIKETIEALKTYNKNNMIGQCLFLYDTNCKNKYNLVNELYETFPELLSEEYLLHNDREPIHGLKYFIGDYFIELCLDYENKDSAEYIYKILMHFKSYYDNPSIELPFESFYNNKNKILEASKVKLQSLSNKLLEIHIKNFLNNKDIFFIYSFDYIFPLVKPNNMSNIFLKFLNKENEKDLNIILFQEAMKCFGNKELNNEFVEISKKYDLEKILYDFQNPKKAEWQLKAEEDNKKRNQIYEEKKKSIKEYFNSKSDENILGNFNELKLITYYLDTAKGLIDDEIRIRFINVMKQLLENYLYKGEANINELSNKLSKTREIDIIYYTALIVNDEDSLNINISDDLKKYLYVLTILNCNVVNKSKPKKFLENIEDSFAKTTLIRFITNIVNDKELDKIFNILNLYSLKNILNTLTNNKVLDTILFNIVKEFNFSLEEDKLQLLNKKYNIEIAKNILDIKNKILLEEKEIIEFFDDLFTFHDYTGIFSKLEEKYKLQIIYNLIYHLQGEIVSNKSEPMTKFDKVLFFLNSKALDFLNINSLIELLNKITSENYWYSSILHTINIKSQNEADAFDKYSVKNLKEFINKNEILNNKDFYEEIKLRFYEIKNRIEDNRDNETLLFFEKEKPKNENNCRDIVANKLKDIYIDIEVNREKLEGNNRTDINIKDKNFEIQVECKKYNNKTLYTGVKHQLIDKYFTSKIQNGIYLIFNFGDKNNNDKIIEKIKKNIPQEYKKNIEIIIINLIT